MKKQITTNGTAGKNVSLSESNIDAIAARVFAKIEERELHFKQVRRRRLKDRVDIPFRPLTSIAVSTAKRA